MKTKSRKFLTLIVSSLIILPATAANSSESTMKLLTCSSKKVVNDGIPYHKWQAVFDSSELSKGKLKYELTEWHAEASKNDGKTFVYPLKVTPSTLEFYESMTLRGKTSWFSTKVDRKTLTYGGRHAPPTQVGACTVENYGNAI